MMVLLPDLIILDHRQDVGSLPLSSALASNFPAIKLLCFAEEKLGAAYRSQPDLPSTSHPFKGNTARGLGCCAGADFGFRHKAASFSNLKTELKTKSEYAKLDVNFAYFGNDCNAPASVPATALQILINLLRK
jgi:hypothetical protein